MVLPLFFVPLFLLIQLQMDLYILKLARQRGDLDLLYDFTKIVAENDSIGEGHEYCGEYTQENFNTGINAIRGGEDSHADYIQLGGIPIYKRHLKEIGAEFIEDWKLKYTEGDLVRDAERDFDVIAHGCNCYCTMGAGIALSIKNNYPEAYEADKASAFADKSKLGTYTQWSNDDITILNMYTQWDYKGTNVKADYEAIRRGMKRMSEEFSGKKIGIPFIGAGLAGGDWGLIEKIIEQELYGEDVTVVVWENTTEYWQRSYLNNSLVHGQ